MTVEGREGPRIFVSGMRDLSPWTVSLQGPRGRTLVRSIDGTLRFMSFVNKELKILDPGLREIQRYKECEPGSHGVRGVSRGRSSQSFRWYGPRIRGE